MNDYFGQELAIGDTVIWGTAMGAGRGFDCGTIVKFNPKKITVQNALKKSGRWIKDKSNPSGGYWDYSMMAETMCYPEQLCKVDPSLLTIKLLSK